MTDLIVKQIPVDWLGNAPYVVIALLILMGLYTVLTHKNLIKIAIGLAVMDSAVNMLLVLTGYRSGGGIPIHYLKGDYQEMVLPTPQAFTLTAIVIALATTAFLLSLIIMVNKHYGTLDIDEIRRLRG